MSQESREAARECLKHASRAFGPGTNQGWCQLVTALVLVLIDVADAIREHKRDDYEEYTHDSPNRI